MLAGIYGRDKPSMCVCPFDPLIRSFVNHPPVDKYSIKPEELYILSCEKGRGRRPRLFSQLRI